MTTDAEAIARRLLEVEDQLRSLSTSAQLGNSTIEGGAIEGRTVEGSLQTVIGVLPDNTPGVLVVNAPPPPTPSAPICTPAPRGYVVQWDGTNDDNSDIQPLDWSRVEIHSAVTTGFEYSPSTLRGTIETPQGGSYVCIAGLEYELGLTDTYEVLLVARNTSGTASAASERVMVTVGQIGAMDIVDFSLTVVKLQSLRHQLY